jgi:hypothetical protein
MELVGPSSSLAAVVDQRRLNRNERWSRQFVSFGAPPLAPIVILPSKTAITSW